MTDRLKLKCPRCAAALSVTATPWSHELQALRQEVDVKRLALDALAIGYHAQRRAVAEMFDDYYVEFMGGRDDWMDDFQSRVDHLVETEGRNLLPKGGGDA